MCTCEHNLKAEAGYLVSAGRFLALPANSLLKINTQAARGSRWPAAGPAAGRPSAAAALLQVPAAPTAAVEAKEAEEAPSLGHLGRFQHHPAEQSPTCSIASARGSTAPLPSPPILI